VGFELGDAGLQGQNGGLVLIGDVAGCGIAALTWDAGTISKSIRVSKG
jgi:hypothetical protein